MKKKFTLIELIIVIVVIGLLAAIALPKVTGIVQNAKISAMINDKETLEKAIILHYQKYDNLPLLNEDQELIVLNDNISLIKLVNAEKINDMETIYESLKETLNHYSDEEEYLYRIDLSKTNEFLSKKLKYGYKKTDKDFYVYSTKTNNVYYYNYLINKEGILQHNEYETSMKESRLIEKKSSINIGSIKNEKPLVKLLTNVNYISPNVNVDWEYEFIDEDKKPTEISFILNNIEYKGFKDIPTRLEKGKYNLELKMKDSKGVWSEVYSINFEVNDDFVVKDKKIETGYFHSMAINVDGELYTWGLNTYGQLGLGDKNKRDIPQKVTLPNGVKPLEISSLGYHTLVIGNDGNLYSWGRNDYGQLGNNSTTNSLVPIKINLPNGVKPISIYTEEVVSFAIGDDGNLYGWGCNVYGQLGIGNTVNKLVPIKISLPNNIKIKEFFVGSIHTMAIGEDDILYAWGQNHCGQLGINSFSFATSPQKVILPTGVKPLSINLHGNYSKMIGDDGNLYVWGENGNSQLGISGGSLKIPTKVENKDIKPVSIFNGIYGSSVLYDDGSFHSFGTVSSVLKNTILNQVDFDNMYLGYYHALVLDKNGRLYGLGSNSNSALGVPNVSNATIPTKITFK